MYESFRREILARLSAYSFTVEQIQTIARAIDTAADHYEISAAERSLATARDMASELIQTFIAVKSIEGLSKGTLTNYKRALDNFFDSVCKSPEYISTNDIRLYLAKYQLERNVSINSLEKLRQMISWFFQWAFSEKYITDNPAINLKRIKTEHKQRHALTSMELERLRYACENARETAILEVMFATGCRVSELACLKKSDINEDGSVHLFGKGKKHRESYLTAKAKLSIDAYLQTRKDDCEYVFVTERTPHTGMQSRSFENIISKIAERAGLLNVSPHVIRHTTATMALNNGMTVTEVQKLLGHASISTTMIYVEQNNQAVKNAHSRCLA